MPWSRLVFALLGPSAHALDPRGIPVIKWDILLTLTCQSTMAAPFVEAEYADPPCTGLETRETDGTWLGCTAYTHATNGTVVLWYGGETYEGLGGGGYRWGAGAAPPGGPGGGPAPELLDGDGDVVPTRWARQGGGGLAQEQGGEGGVAGRDPAAVVVAPQSAHRFLPFEAALAVARSVGQAGMSGQKEWRAWCKNGMRPAGIPADPASIYKDSGWQGWGHWLGTGNQSSKPRRSCRSSRR